MPKVPASATPIFFGGSHQLPLHLLSVAVFLPRSRASHTRIAGSRLVLSECCQVMHPCTAPYSFDLCSYCNFICHCTNRSLPVLQGHDFFLGRAAPSVTLSVNKAKHGRDPRLRKFKCLVCPALDSRQFCHDAQDVSDSHWCYDPFCSYGDLLMPQGRPRWHLCIPGRQALINEEREALRPSAAVKRGVECRPSSRTGLGTAGLVAW